ncbi:MAG: alpha-E domain-containing protein [Psychrobacillus sp.]
MIIKSSAFKIFYFGWYLSKLDTDIKIINNYINVPDVTFNPNNKDWWVPLIQKLGVEKDFIYCYPNECSRENILDFLVKDLNNNNSLLNKLYSIKEYSNGTLPIDVYNQIHQSIEYIKNLPNEQILDSFSLILEQIQKDINSVIGNIAINTKYMY